MVDEDALRAAALAQRLAAELAEYSRGDVSAAEGSQAASADVASIKTSFDERIVDGDLRSATRSRFHTEHYADAVEAGVKCLCDVIRSRSGSVEDGDALMTSTFSPKAPVLRINAGRSKNDESEQRGHMMLCQGVVGSWRNPRAHSLIEDSPERTLMMLEMIQSLIETTKSSTRTRKRK
ncbi:MAG: TIGR02391 family protein [Actinobacteria bacterium]|nr:TIGR02391 family protein [Actinomycetota bacterium]